MRARALLWTLLPAATLPVGQAQDAALDAAVAPGQTAVDAAASIIELAIQEATRDGTPDAATSLLARLETFVAPLGEGEAVSSDATHAAEARAAIAYARDVASAVAPIPDDVGHLARASEQCTRGELSDEEAEQVASARLLAAASAQDLAKLASAAPRGVDADALDRAALQLKAWSGSVERIVHCDNLPDVATQPFVRLDLTPSVAWPTATVHLRGVATVVARVHVEAAALGINATLPVEAGAFRLDAQVPANMSEASVRFVATAGNATAAALLAVRPLEPTLRVSGPAVVDPSGDIVFDIVVESAAPSLTDALEVQVGGAGGGTVRLANGTGAFRVQAPEAAGPLRFTFETSAPPAVAPARETVTILVLAPSVAAEGGPGPDLALWAGAGAVVLILAAAAVLALRRRRAATVAEAPAEAPLSARWDEEAPSFLLLFSRLVRRLRHEGRIRPSTTAREMRPLFARAGVDAGEMVSAFERVRYGGEPEPPSLVERARGWLRDAWARLRGVDA